MKKLKSSLIVICLAGLMTVWNLHADAETGPPDRGAGLAEVVKYYPLAYAQMDTIRREMVMDLSTAKLFGRRQKARADSLQHKFDFATVRLEWAEGEQPRWYNDPRLWFCIGAAAMAAIVKVVLAP